MSDRIRWEDGTLGNLLGYVGTHEPWMFQIYKPRDFPWALTIQLPGMEGIHARRDDPRELKPEAERLLREFASSFGAIFPDAPDARWQALRDYLDKRITELKEDAIEELPPPGSLARVFQEKAATLASVRKQMDELEAGK